MRSTYILDDRSYDVEFFKKDCETAPTGIDSFPIVFKDANEIPMYTNTSMVKEIETEIEWTYNQTKIEMSDIWFANKTGGYSEFCIRVNNYLPEMGDPFAREVSFLEVTYKIEVDALTDFNETIFNVFRVEAIDGVAEGDGAEFINYEEEIVVFQCEDDFSEIESPPALTQGDFLQLCVRTQDGSKFGVHSVKELDISQEDDTPSLYPYIDGFIPSPLAETACTDSNTTAAICRSKMQLLSSYYDLDDPADLFANGTVKLDYVGRRLSVDVPVNLRVGGDSNLATEGRALAERDGGAFAINVELSSTDESTSTAFSMEGLFASAMSFAAGGSMLNLV